MCIPSLGRIFLKGMFKAGHTNSVLSRIAPIIVKEIVAASEKCNAIGLIFLSIF